MSFQKLNLCVSAQRAFDVFYMLRTDMANMVRKDLGDTTDELVRYEVGEYASHAKELRDVAELISSNCRTFHEIRIHDVEYVQGQSVGESAFTRVVEFCSRSAYGNLTTVIITLIQKFNGDGLAPWRLQSVLIDAPAGEVYKITVSQTEDVLPSKQMREIAGDGLLVFE